ncbi:stage II sporulation protein E (SpoIIE) [Oxobacter pfennigii]|uniref:Stage II sporulation protein E (SpoIIE) n=1 Tax=Oxobacter pfennigii TaxID=36849 RepID=A0A0P8WDP6_9CLOT|nr:SpoIIE family protein phosphatase [Oxobacter pfennigii]KPU46110.1 stage II sporulation protein E (SpoIIE) [Oxobacter pfennigii]
MSYYLETYHESMNKYNEELCGDKVEVIREDNSIVMVLADGLGSGVKANILSTLTAKIIGTMLANGSGIDEAVETIVSTLPVDKERGVAYSTFTILQLFKSGKGYLVEFDNPSAFRLNKEKLIPIETTTRVISEKIVREARFDVEQEDLFVIVSDGVVHAGIGGRLNLGWQWKNVGEYIQNANKDGMNTKAITKLLLNACSNLYNKKPGDDVTIAAVKAKRPVTLNLMVGPPADKKRDEEVVMRFAATDGVKVVCGGTTAQIVARELGKKIIPNFNYFNPSVPPTAEIDGIDLVTEGVITIKKALGLIKACVKQDSTMEDFLSLNNKDGASRLAKMILNEGTNINIFLGRAMNPAHENTEFPTSLSMKIGLVEEIVSYLNSIGKQVTLEYY